MAHLMHWPCATLLHRLLWYQTRLVVSVPWILDQTRDRPTQLCSFARFISEPMSQMSHPHQDAALHQGPWKLQACVLLRSSFKKKKIFTCIFQGTKENASSHMVGGGFPTHKLFSGSYKAKYRFPGRKSIAQNQYVQNSLHTSIRYWALQAANTPAGQAAGTLMTKMLVQLCSLQAEQLWQVFGLCFFIKSYSGLGQIRQIGEVELPHLVLEAAKPEVKGFWPHGWVLLEY